MLELIWNDELARLVLQLEKHRETYPGSRAFNFRLTEAYAILGEFEKVSPLSPRTEMIIAAQQSRDNIALTMIDELAAAEALITELNSV